MMIPANRAPAAHGRHERIHLHRGAERAVQTNIEIPAVRRTARVSRVVPVSVGGWVGFGGRGGRAEVRALELTVARSGRHAAARGRSEVRVSPRFFRYDSDTTGTEQSPRN